MSETRKIAAILFADEERTLARLRRMTAMARTPVLPEATPVGALSAQMRRPPPRSAMSG
jgi:hypothetical protein